MKRLLLALFLMASAGLVLYACSSDDSLAPGNKDSGSEDDSGSSSDGGLGSDGKAPSDGGTTEDAGDASLNETSLQIQAVKNAAVAFDAGADAGEFTTVSLPIDHALVTFVRPAVGGDPAGFFLQSQKTGPAVFVAIDPATLTPAPVPGDDVSMTVTQVENVVSLHEITEVTGFARNSQGNDIGALLRDVSNATDLVSKLNNYESEYIKVDGFIASSFGGSAAGSVSAQITTTAVSSGNNSLKLRIPVTLQQQYDPELTCSFSLTGVMWRFANNAEPSGFTTSDLTVTCANPKVASAVATSLNSVDVVFDRNLSPSTVMSNGSQFTILGTAALNVTAATMKDARTVSLTTDTQTQGDSYTVTVATSIEDVLNKPLDGAHDTATFIGFLTPASVLLSELSPKISGSKDLVELKVTADGDLNGMQIKEDLVTSNAKILAVLPRLHVTAGDIVVVHLNNDLTDGGTGPVTNETTTKGDCTDSSCFAGAWDVKDVSAPRTFNGLTDSSRTIVVTTPNGIILDALAWFDSGGSPNGNFADEVNALIDAGQWVTCGGGFCPDRDAALGISFDFKNNGSTVGGKNTQRDVPTDTNSAADWWIDAGTMGAANF